MNILLLSDTHSYIDEAILKYVNQSDEVWHAGDIGSIKVADKIASIKPFRAVHGNIDDHQIRITYPEKLVFDCNGMKVFMKHIGGSPQKLNTELKQEINQIKPGIFICGHSHILKVERDPKSGTLFINPGAAGIYGFHVMRTMIRFKIDAGKISEMDVIELGPRGTSPEAVG